MTEGFTRTERFLSLFTYLRPGEGRAALSLCAQSFVLMLAYYLLKVIREPMILAEGSAELKAYSNAVQAVLLMIIVPLFAHIYHRLEGRTGKHHLFHNTLLFLLSNLVLFGITYRAGWAVGTLFYIWLGIFSVMILALFWAFAADLFNLKSGQRIFPLIVAASALGALVGSGTASRLDLLLGHDGVMYCAALLLSLPLWLSRAVEHRIPEGSRTFEPQARSQHAYPLLEGFRIVQRNRYLSLIAVFVILLNLINTNGQYILTSFVEDWSKTHGGEAAIALFWSRYLFLTTLIGFLIQLLLVSRIFKNMGISGALHILPVLMIANYSLIALFPLLAVARVSMLAEDSVNYSLQTTTRHALFLPVNREEKYVGKHTIDTFFFRLGDVLSASFVWLAGAVLGLGIVGFAAINILLSVGLLAISRLIGRRHDRAAQQALGNLPPVVAAPLEDQFVPAGELSSVQLDAQTFVDPDVGDALRYRAFAGEAERLPAWVKFDTLSRCFYVHPPARTQGSLPIRVVARDYDGLEAEVSFTLHYGD